MAVDDETMLETLRDVFAEHVVDDPRAVDDLALSAGELVDGRPRPLPVLMRGRCPILRSRSRTRLVRLIDTILGSLAAPSPAATVGVRDMGAIVRGGHAALVPRQLLARSTGTERAIERAGASIAEPEEVRLDPVAGRVVIVPGLVVPTSLPSGDPLRTDPGAYALSGVFSMGLDHAPRERPATGLVRLLQQVVDPGTLTADQILRGLASVPQVFSPVPLKERGDADLPSVFGILGS